MKRRTGNLFEGIPRDSKEERLEALFQGDDVLIERILSFGQSSPKTGWFDQERDEWVALLEGKARLVFEGDPAPLELGPGDWVYIPAHARHRVAWTDPAATCVWLAIHLKHEGRQA